MAINPHIKLLFLIFFQVKSTPENEEEEVSTIDVCNASHNCGYILKTGATTHRRLGSTLLLYWSFSHFYFFLKFNLVSIR